MKRPFQILLLGAASTLVLSGLAWGVLPAAQRLGTTFAPGYSEQAFQSLAVGDSEQAVLAALGPPLWEVGYLFYYYYRGRDLVFLVNTDESTATLAKFSKASEDVKAAYVGIATLDQLTEALGPPERFIGASSGQSDDPDVKTLIYSKQDQDFHLPWWQYRIVFIHKETGKVTRKYGVLMAD